MSKTLKDLLLPFKDNEIGKLPKPTAKQTAEAKAPKWNRVKCKLCSGSHHPDVVHLDYVGHAALTKRMLEVDPSWDWEPLALKDGLPAFDVTGGLWIKLTILGVTRLGYGHAAVSSFKDVGAREKEVIGDALRNAGMRFGMALDLWHKGDLWADDSDDEIKPVKVPELPQQNDYIETWQKWMDYGFSRDWNQKVIKDHITTVKANQAVKDYYNTKLKEVQN